MEIVKMYKYTSVWTVEMGFNGILWEGDFIYNHKFFLL